MTVNQGEDFSALHERVLTFMGAFSSVQLVIDGIIGMYLRRQLPSLGEELDKVFLRRIHDDQRLSLFKAFAANVNYTANMSDFEQIYNRAKQVRDKAGHANWIGGPVLPSGVVGMASTARNTSLVPEPLYPSTFTRLTMDCEWLRDHVNRAGFEGNACNFVTGDGKPYEPPIPARLPVGGEPL